MPSRETKDILQELAMQIQPNNISRFNINCRNVWDDACRDFGEVLSPQVIPHW